MQRRSFVKRLFGAVLAGVAAPRVGVSAAESGTYAPMVGGRYAADQPMFPMEGGFYRAGDTFEITGGKLAPGTRRYKDFAVIPDP